MALIGTVFDSIEVGERALFERLLGKLTGDMLPADRGYPSCDLYTAGATTGAHLLWHVSGSFALPVKKRLDDGTHLSELRGKRTQERATVPAIELARIYADRRHVEIPFRLVKVDLRTPGGVPRSRTADGMPVGL